MALDPQLSAARVPRPQLVRCVERLLAPDAPVQVAVSTARLAHTGIGPFVRALWSHGVFVNGRRCPPLSRQFDRLARCAPLRQVVVPPGGTACHGDLIPEDILPNPLAPGDVVLIDPNPRNCSALVDLGKLLMALLVRYELAAFHVLHHRKVRRGLLFLSIGMCLLETALCAAGG
jgi:hypothetical protein